MRENVKSVNVKSVKSDRRVHLCLNSAVFSAALLLSIAASSSAEVVGYSGLGNNIVELGLTQAGDSVPDGEQWEISGLNSIRGIEVDENGQMFVTSNAAIGGISTLFSIDLELGTSVLLRSLGVWGDSDLAFDADGLLWLSNSAGEIYSYDLEMDQLTLETTLSGEPGGIAWWGGRFYVVLRPAIHEEPPVLAVVDTATGELSGHQQLPSLASDDVFLKSVDSLDFDSGGGMWIGFTSASGIIDPPLSLGSTAHYSSLADSSPTIRSLSVSHRPSVPLAVRGRVAPVEVPALGPVGLGVLGALLLMSAFWRLRAGARP